MDAEVLDELGHVRLAAEAAGMELPDVHLPESRHVVLGAMRFHYLDWGSWGRPPIVFLHGGGLNAHTWDLVALALCADHRCVALDQRGHGDSEWSPEMDYRVEAHVGDVERLVAHLGFARPVLVGQSMGALNAFAYARRHADRVRGLVLVDAGPGVRLGGAQRIVDFVRATAEAASVDELVAQARSFNARRDPRLLRRSVLHNFRQRPDGRYVRKHDLRHLAAVDAAALAARFEAEWSGAVTIGCRVLVVRGAESDVFLDDDARRFAATFPDGAWVRIERAGHTVQGDNPRGLVAALRTFLATLKRGASSSSRTPRAITAASRS